MKRTFFCVIDGKVQVVQRHALDRWRSHKSEVIAELLPRSGDRHAWMYIVKSMYDDFKPGAEVELHDFLEWSAAKYPTKSVWELIADAS